jgi:hypothetical protein
MLVLAGCAATPVEEVIPRGVTPGAGLWCEVFSPADIGALLGDRRAEAMGRVREVGRLAPGHKCEVVWADGETAVELAEANFRRAVPSMDPFIPLSDAQGFLGPDGERVASGEVREIAPGTYYEGAKGLLSIQLACLAGDELVQVTDSDLYAKRTESGRELTAEELVTVGERLTDVTLATYECDGDLSPLTPQDISELVARSDAL